MRLRTYVIRRTIILIPTFFFISALVFTLIHLAPGDPVMVMVPRHGLPRETLDRIREESGLNEPLPVQYAIWLSSFLRGDLYSYVSGRPVWDMIAQRLPYTLELMFIAQIVSVATAIVLGVISALKKHSLVSSVISLGARIVYFTPHFWIAIMAIAVFVFKMRLFPGWEPQTHMTFASPIDAWVDHLAHLTLPALVLAVGWTPPYFLKVKSSMLGVLKQDYITTARTKGQKERVVILKHALGNALLTLLKYEGYLIGFLISGTVVIECIFGWPGLFDLFIISSYYRDVFAIWGVSLTIMLMVLFVNFCTDITYRILNPRTRRTPN
jgi:peptide/nickel transport system permease protein